MFEATRRDDVLELRRPDTEWLSTGWAGGRCRADALHSLTVPEGWYPEEMAADVAQRLAEAGFERDGPVLLTGVDACHARGARLGPVEVFATAGVSNPAELPVPNPWGETRSEDHEPREREVSSGDDRPRPGTVNVVVGTERALEEAALANLIAVAAEAKAATLSALVGVPGTTSDAVVAATNPAGEASEYSGSATDVGAAARVCVREAVSAALVARYPDQEFPQGVNEAEYGVVADERATVVRP